MKRRESRWVRFITVAIVRPLMSLLVKREWRGQENIPRSGGLIVAANHLSMTDPLTIAHYLYVAKRWPTFMAKEGVFRIPVVGTVARTLGQIPVYRDRGDAGLALKEAERALAESESAIIVYPEGTCTRDPDLWPMVAKTGVARLALTTKAPVVPLAHWGEQELLPYGSAKPRLLPRKRVRIVAGPVVDLSAYEGRPLNASTLRDATTEIMRAITDLQAGLRGETPPDRLYDPRTARRAAFGDAEATAAESAKEGRDDTAPGHGDPGGDTHSPNRG